MENIKLHYWLIGIFTSIILIFAMSHNASATQTFIDLSNYEIIENSTVLQINSTYVNSNTGQTSECTNSWSCAAPNNSSNTGFTIRNLYSTTNFTNKVGDIIEFDIVMYGPDNWSNLTGFNYLMPTLSANEWELLSVTKTIDNSFYNNYSTVLQGTTDTLVQGNTYNAVYHYIIRSKTNNSLPIGWRYQINIFSYTSSFTVRYALMSYIRYRVRGDGSSQDQQNEINATNDAVDDSEDAGDSSSSSAQSGTTGLLNAINGAISVITTASPTNCQINGNMGNLDIGQIDLCANPVPVFIQTIGSLLLILMCVPLAISLFNRFIALFRSFQN